MKKEINPKLSKNLFSPIKAFIEMEAFSGILLMLVTGFALLLANSSFYNQYEHFFESVINMSWGKKGFNQPLHFIINDFLMAIFFLLVGLEIKREVQYGELSDLKQAMLPIVGALGGMVFPAFIYLFFNSGTSTSGAWGIPVATDIAFAIGVISLLGKRVPMPLKIFLTALAIVDDIGAVLVIAVSYSSNIDWMFMGLSLLVVGALVLLNKIRVTNLNFYLILGLILWIFVLYSGVHATLSGVILAFTIPSNPKISLRDYIPAAQKAVTELKEIDSEDDPIQVLNLQQSILYQLKSNTVAVVNPLLRLEHALQPWVSYFIMPLFALANAGIVITSLSSGHPDAWHLSLGIFCGLLFGKMLGIFAFSFLSIKLKICAKPKGVTWFQFLGVSCLGGIGFTMSIFIANLALDNPILLNSAKLSILITSLTASVVASVLLFLGYKPKSVAK